MNDNYLWDKSGEPDEEVQHLEMLLSEFRYQPRPLVLPEAAPQRTIFNVVSNVVSMATWRYAAIAAVALFALGLGLWLSLRPATQTLDIANVPTQPTPMLTPVPSPVPQVVAPAPALQQAKQIPAAAPKAHFAKHTPKRASKKSLAEEGERAKEKVLYALQVTSEKLNLIARKIQTDTN